MFSNSPKKFLYIWATFVRKFLSKNLQKSPNLVTLHSSSFLDFGDIWRVLDKGNKQVLKLVCTQKSLETHGPKWEKTGVRSTYEAGLRRQTALVRTLEAPMIQPRTYDGKIFTWAHTYIVKTRQTDWWQHLVAISCNE